ncbi:MAG: tRNA (uracil-5-)-methyltransferase [Candidatus Woesearchaeota archaeon]|nr:tRNA (uracil-5-)-methyltransferase [Candidatus Woesearchaeota archaeon]
MKVKIKGLDLKKMYGFTFLNERKKRKILIPKTLENEVVEIKLIRKGKKRIAKVLEFYETSKKRIKPKCKHFELCGGCALQHLCYEEQFSLKQQVTNNIFGFEIPGIRANKIFGYRNRMDFIVKKENDKIALGLREPLDYDSFVKISDCKLMNEESFKAFKAVNENLKNLDVSVYNQEKREGCLRYVVVQGTNKTNLVSLLVNENCNEKELEKLKQLSKDERIKNLVINYTNSLSDISQDARFEVVKGNHFLEQRFLDYIFKYPFNGFFQRNPEQFEVLVLKIKEMIKKHIPNHNERNLFDLFSGVGLFSISLSDLFKEVQGYELSKEMVELAKENALNNNLNIKKAKFNQLDLYKTELEIMDKDVVIFDPPRAGLGKKMIKTILKNKPEYVIYVSCNPRSQMADFNIIKENYDLKDAFWVDMFPQTAHMESVLILNRR